MDNTVEVAEASGDDSWFPLPRWVRWFVDFGYQIPPVQQRRTLTIISTPGESAAAGLVALGLVRRRLEAIWGEDESGYYARLFRLAQSNAEAGLRHIPTQRNYRLLKPVGSTLKAECVSGKQKGQILVILPYHVFAWQVDDEPAVIAPKGEAIANSPVFHDLFPGAPPVLGRNLSCSDFSVCLVSRTEGRVLTETALHNVRLRCRRQEMSLGQLLLPARNLSSVARLSVFNSRSEKFAWPSRKPDVAVCDGGKALMKIADLAPFRQANLVAVVNRVCSSEETEDLVEFLRTRQQWFRAVDLDESTWLPGVAVFQLEQQ